MKKIVYYKTESGKCPYLDWYNSLDNSVKAQITKRILRVSEGNFGDSKKLNAELSELRFKIGSGYRIYYTEFENYIVGEQIIKIEHCLLGVPGAKEEEIKTVFSTTSFCIPAANRFALREAETC